MRRLDLVEDAVAQRRDGREHGRRRRRSRPRGTRRTSGSSRSRSQYQSSTRSSPCSESTCGRRGACGGVGGVIGGEPKRTESARGRPLRFRARCRPTTTPIPYTAGELDAVAFDADGLVPAIVQEAGHRPGADGRLDEPRGARAHARRPAARGSGAAAARSTGARARRRATGSTSARRTTTATWTCCCSSSSRRAGARATRASAAASSARSASGATPGPV